MTRLFSKKRLIDSLPLASWMLLLATPAVQAQSAGAAVFPTQPITVVVPYTPTSGADIAARALGPFMARKLGQAVVIENRAGASGTLGTAAVVRAAPDGHTLLMTADTLTMVPSLYKKLSFSPAKDLQPIGAAATGTLALLVNPAIPATTVAEFIALAKKQPGKYSYASPGNGTPQHISMELFRQSAGVDLLHVPYKGMANALTDLVGGQVDVGFVSLHVAAPHIANGRLRMLAVADTQRAASAPKVPSFREVGMPELSNPSWIGLFAPAGTPQPVLDKLYAALSQALRDPEVQSAMQSQGLRVSASTPAELAKKVEQDLARWHKVITTAAISAD